MGTGFAWLRSIILLFYLWRVYEAMEKDGLRGEDSLLCSDEEFSLEAKINAWPSWSGRISRKNDTGAALGSDRHLAT